jgi:hypothetical protein
MEVDADAVGQHGGNQQPGIEAQASIEAEAIIGTNTEPEATAEGNVPEPTANIVAMDVEPALGLPIGLPISENEHHPANNHINNPLPANAPALDLYDPSNFTNDNAIAQTFSFNGIDPANIGVFAAPLPNPMANQPLQSPPQVQLQQPAYYPVQQSTAYPGDPYNPMPTLTAELHPPEPHPRFQLQHNTNLDPQDPRNYYNNLYTPANTTMGMARPEERGCAVEGVFFGTQQMYPNPTPNQSYHQGLTQH